MEADPQAIDVYAFGWFANPNRKDGEYEMDLSGKHRLKTCANRLVDQLLLNFTNKTQIERNN